MAQGMRPGFTTVNRQQAFVRRNKGKIHAMAAGLLTPDDH